jgi:hypothetical protein
VAYHLSFVLALSSIEGKACGHLETAVNFFQPSCHDVFMLLFLSLFQSFVSNFLLYNFVHHCFCYAALKIQKVRVNILLAIYKSQLVSIFDSKVILFFF